MKKLLLLFGVLLVSIGMKAETSITLVNIIPAEDTQLTEIGNFVFTFSDNVTVESAQIQLAPGNALAIPSRVIATNGKVVTIDLSGMSEDLMSNGGFNISLKVKDSNGTYVTYGGVENYVSAGYTVAAEVVRNTFEPVKVEPTKDSSVESLKTIQLTFIDVANRQGGFVGAIDHTKKAQLLDASNNKVAEGVLAEVKLASTDFLPGAVSVTLDSEVTADGTYTLVIPEQAIYNEEANPDEADFGIANEMDPGAIIYNPELRYNYTVSSPLTYTITPNGEEKLSEVPDNVVFTFSKSVTITGAYVVLGRDNSTEVTDQIAVNTGTEITVPIPSTLKEEILANGFFMVSLNGENDLSAMAEYTMIVPLNTLELQKAEPDNNSSVKSLSVITLTYGIAGTGWSNPGIGISGIDKAKENVELKNADNVVAATGKITISEDQLSLIVTLDETVTTSGIYTLTIPEATVYDDQADVADDGYVDVNSNFTKEATYNPEVTLTYTISPSGISMVQTIPAGEVNVYSVQGILLRKGDATVVLNGLAEGIYIVNGQKMAISK